MKSLAHPRFVSFITISHLSRIFLRIPQGTCIFLCPHTKVLTHRQSFTAYVIQRITTENLKQENFRMGPLPSSDLTFWRMVYLRQNSSYLVCFKERFLLSIQMNRLSSLDKIQNILRSPRNIYFYGYMYKHYTSDLISGSNRSYRRLRDFVWVKGTFVTSIYFNRDSTLEHEKGCDTTGLVEGFY